MKNFRRIAIFCALACACAFLLWRVGETAASYEWHWARAWRSLLRWNEGALAPGPLLEGVWITLGAAGLGIAFSAALGVALCVFRLSAWPLCQKLALAHITVFRNTPLLLQLFFVYFLVSPLFNLSPFWSAVLCLSAFEAAYVAELFRGALLGVSRTQWEAGISLGFSLGQCFFYVILPQAFRRALPAFTSQAIATLKDSSLVGAIAVADLTMRAQAVIAETFLAFEVWLIAGLFYLVFALCLALPGLWLEKRQAWL